MQRLGSALARISRRYAPDSFVFALLLSFLVFGLGWGLTDYGPQQLLGFWYEGFWNLLAFSMQMVLILVTGYGLATAPVVAGFLRRLATLPKSPGQAVALVSLVSGILGWFNWGFSLIASALFAREVAVAGRVGGLRVHFPLVAAAGYTGSLVWHGGLSGSAPLVVNTAGHFLEDQMGLISLQETIFSPMNLFITGALILFIPLVFSRLHPPSAQVQEMELVDEPVPQVASPSQDRGFIGRLESSPLLVWIVGLAGALVLVDFFRDSGLLGLDLNIMNFALLVGGLVLHRSLAGYASAVRGGVAASAGVILQFPFYAGIMGIMGASGLASLVAGWFVAVSTPLTYPFWTLLSAAVINFAVPSGGGQWAVQGPIVLEAAQSIGVDLGRSIMAVAYGDELTNMVQPFWALPLLGITKLKAGDILGYTAVAMVVAFVVMALGVTLLP